MKGYLCFILLLATLVVSGCGGKDLQVGPGQEVVLSPGQRLTIVGEDLQVKFLRVSSDSRCPRGAQCIWAGEAKCEIELTSAGTSTVMTLTERGLTDACSIEVPQGYLLSFHIMPYPEVERHIPAEKYRLRLSVTRAVPLTTVIGPVLARPSDFQGHQVTIVGYYRGWDLLQEAGTPPPVTRSDWVIKDASGAIYVSASSQATVPEGLSPNSPQSASTLLEVRGIVRLTRTGQPYIEATSIRRLP